MSQFGVRVNGVPRYFGTMLATRYGFPTSPSAGLTQVGALTEFLASDGGAYLIESVGNVFINSAALQFGVGGTADGYVQRIGANRLGVYDGSTTAGTIRLGQLEFDANTSTFAQTATITNGPRAANPVTWVSVSYNNGGSTGRVPVW